MHHPACAFLGIKNLLAFVRELEGEGCIERFVRTAEAEPQNLLWVRRFDTIAELRRNLDAFKDTYKR